MLQVGRKASIGSVLLLCALWWVAYWFYVIDRREETDSAFIEADIVTISPKISGYVTDVLVSDNQEVRSGNPLVLIDIKDYQIAVERAQAALEAAQARYEQATKSFAVTKVAAPSSLQAARAAVASAKAEYARAHQDAVRNRQLRGIATSARVIEQSDAAEATAKARLTQAEAELKSAETSPETIAGADAGTRVLLAQVNEAKAALAAAKTNLESAQLKAPFSGRVTKRTVLKGAYVMPGQSLMAITGNKMWVVANFKETQVGRIYVGQSVDIEVDSLPGKKFIGRVESIQRGTGARLSLFPPENATGNFVKVVQRVPVKIDILFDTDPDQVLVPGMSVTATVHVR